MAESGDDGKVIALPGRIASAKRMRSVSKVDHERKCLRHSWLVDPRKRTVHCRVCGQITDALDVLLELIDQNDRMLWSSEERRKMQHDIEALKKEVASLKAARRRLVK
jgi:hypothetical protein